MTSRKALRPIALLLLLGLCGAPAAAATKAPAKAAAKPAAARPIGGDWSRTVTALPNGAFLLGNPAAKSRLVEYMSYSCPHCADFGGKPTAELKAGWVKRGALSIEYRNFIRDGFDLVAALLARCGGAARFLGNHEAIFGGYEDWIAKAESYAQSHRDPPPESQRSAQFIEIADATGLTALVGKQGITATAAHQCLSDPAALSTVLALTAGAWDVDPDFEGTPTFLLNGKVLRGVHAWEGLKPALPPLPGSSN